MLDRVMYVLYLYLAFSVLYLTVLYGNSHINLEAVSDGICSFLKFGMGHNFKDHGLSPQYFVKIDFTSSLQKNQHY